MRWIGVRMYLVCACCKANHWMFLRPARIVAVLDFRHRERHQKPVIVVVLLRTYPKPPILPSCKKSIISTTKHRVFAIGTIKLEALLPIESLQRCPAPSMTLYSLRTFLRET